MRTLIILSSVAALFVAAGQAQERLNSPGLTLQGTFDLYLRSIHERDLETLMSTVTSGPKMIFLTTSGRVIDTVEDYRRFHVEWFAEQDWTIDFKMIGLHEGVEYGYVLTKYRYAGKDPEGRPYESESYFTLIFHKEDGMWKVVQDQITSIRKQ